MPRPTLSIPGTLFAPKIKDEIQKKLTASASQLLLKHFEKSSNVFREDFSSYLNTQRSLAELILTAFQDLQQATAFPMRSKSGLVKEAPRLSTKCKTDFETIVANVKLELATNLGEAAAKQFADASNRVLNPKDTLPRVPLPGMSR